MRKIPMVVVGSSRFVECPRPRHVGYTLLTVCKRCKSHETMENTKYDYFGLMKEGTVICNWGTKHEER